MVVHTSEGVDILLLLSHPIIINDTGPKGQLIFRVSTHPFLLSASMFPICAALPAPSFYSFINALGSSVSMAHFSLNLDELLLYEPAGEF